MRVKVSAPGKLMLLGEHAVVYGYPCLVTAVDKRIHVEVEKIENEKDIIDSPQVKESRFVEESINFFKKRFDIAQSVKFQTNGDFSHRVGLGSSSAVTVATFKALSTIFGKNLTLRDIFNLSYHMTLKIQGVGSGFDIAAAAFGKTLYYLKGGEIIEPLLIDKLPLVIGYSGRKADTPTLIRKVASLHKKKRKKVDEIFKKMSSLVEKAKAAIERQDFEKLGQLVKEDHRLLRDLKVSTPKLDRMVEAATSAGAEGAKLSGAGGGDCMIALVDEDKRSLVEKAIKEAGGEIIKTKANVEGVRLENKK